MKYVRIFLLHWQDILTDRTRALVWFFIPVVNGGFFLLFWHGAFQGNKQLLAGWDINAILTYYLLLVIASTLLMSHTETLVQSDIVHGGVVKYLTKPFPYYWFMFFNELPYRLLQGSYAIIAYCIIAFLFPSVRISFGDLATTFLTIAIFICAFFLTHTYKMILGIIAFWTKDTRGIIETSEVAVLIFAGFNVPITLLPGVLADIAAILPFSYFVYFPVISLQGKLAFVDMLHVFLIQLVWLILFILIYKMMLRNGLRKFTAVGQ